MIEIRSYRRVFDLERRIYRVDRLRLNPGGIPVRGLAYLIVILAGILVGTRAPLLGPVLARVPWYLLDVALPVSAAALLGVMRLEGRPFHLAALALLRRRLVSPRRLGLATRPRRPRRWDPGTIAFLPDGGDGRLRALRYRGPGAVAVGVAHVRLSRRRRWIGALRPRRSELVLRPAAHGGQPTRREVIVLGAGAQLRVRTEEQREHEP